MLSLAKDASCIKNACVHKGCVNCPRWFLSIEDASSIKDTYVCERHIDYLDAFYFRRMHQTLLIFLSTKDTLHFSDTYVREDHVRYYDAFVHQKHIERFNALAYEGLITH